ncbi:MAG TPA: Hsp70 family protein, partial [Myxococcota bacterium]|nr:Hsp70 family protein [Myxococcota bacterium]
SLRIGVAGGLAETVIERNTPVPIEQTRAFTTTQDGQEKVLIRVYQGESRASSENEALGEFEFGGFRRAARGQVTIDVTFEINADGIVNVTATDRETDLKASTRITLSSGLSEGEIEQILDERRTERVKTQPIAAPREVIGAVRLVTTPVRAVPEARPRAAAAAEPLDEAPVAKPRAAAARAGAPAPVVPGDFAEDDLLDVDLDNEVVLPSRSEPEYDEELIDASIEASAGLFDDGADAPELTEAEEGLLDTSSDASLFESAGVDLTEDDSPEGEEPA